VRGSCSSRQGGATVSPGAAGPVIFTAFDRAFVIWSLRRLEGGCGSVHYVREVQPALGPRVIHSGACCFV
jgi:hypothetical protein